MCSHHAQRESRAPSSNSYQSKGKYRESPVMQWRIFPRRRRGPRSLPIILRKPEPWPWVAQCLSDIVSWCDCLVDHHRLLVRKFPISYRILFLRNQKTTYCPFPFAYSHYPIGTVSAQLMAHDGLFTISLRRGVVCRRHLQVFFQLYEESRCDSHRVKRCKYWACIHSFCFQMSESNDTHANEVCPVCDEPYFL